MDNSSKPTSTSFSKCRKGALICSGSFTKVFMGIDIDSGNLVAIKQVVIAANGASRERAQAKIRELEDEIKLLKNLLHPNIVRYLGTVREEETLDILLEYVPGGSISFLLVKFGPFPEAVTRACTKQLLLGLDYLHNNGIVHKDIKGANILVDNKGWIKLADFGASKQVAELATVSATKPLNSTSHWMAPEVIKQTGHTFSADVWSVGCTVIEMATGNPPQSQQSQEVAANHGKIKYHPEIPEHLSAEAKDFLLNCLQEEPNMRPDASKLLQHPFVTGNHLAVPVICSQVTENSEVPCESQTINIKIQASSIFGTEELFKDGDELAESKIRAFLDEKALELEKLQTPLYDEFYESLNYWRIKVKSRSPSRLTVGTPSTNSKDTSSSQHNDAVKLKHLPMHSAARIYLCVLQPENVLLVKGIPRTDMSDLCTAVKDFSQENVLSSSDFIGLMSREPSVSVSFYSMHGEDPPTVLLSEHTIWPSDEKAFMQQVTGAFFSLENRVAWTVLEESMEPTFWEGSKILVEMDPFKIFPIKINDVIVFEVEVLQQKLQLLKRVVGLPDDSLQIRNGHLFRNGSKQEEEFVKEPIQYTSNLLRVPKDCFYVLGDNRNLSNDSHLWGPITLYLNHCKGHFIMAILGFHLMQVHHH